MGGGRGWLEGAGEGRVTRYNYLGYVLTSPPTKAVNSSLWLSTSGAMAPRNCSFSMHSSRTAIVLTLWVEVRLEVVVAI